MLNSIKRGLKCRQPGVVEIVAKISGTAGTPAASGQDAYFVLSVEDLGTGSYKINFKEKSLQNITPKSLVSFTAGAVLSIAAVDKSSITVTSEDGDGAAVDADFGFVVNYDTQVPYYF